LYPPREEGGEVIGLRTSVGLKDVAGWWVLGVLIGGLSGAAAGALTEFYPLVLAATLGGALAAIVASAVRSRKVAPIDPQEFRAQDALIGDLVDQLTELEAVVQSMRYQEQVPSPPLPGFDRLQ
jgi:hypothetical protein